MCRHRGSVGSRLLHQMHVQLLWSAGRLLVAVMIVTRGFAVIHSRFPFWMTGFEVTTSLGISTLSIGSFIDPKSTVGTSPKISLSLLALVFIVYIQLRMQRIQGANGLMSACFASVCGRQRSLPACRHVWVCISVHPWSSKKERVCISR